MVKRYIFGTPIDTEAVLNKPDASIWQADEETPFPILIDGKNIKINMNKGDIVYGLGETVRGINKRGHKYISYCTDDPKHTEDKNSLYGAHNFIMLNSTDETMETLGIFVDNPGRVTFDIGATDTNVINIEVTSGSYDLYLISGPSPIDVIKEFRALIGKSYIPPKWGFGYAQSRWGYKSSEDFREVYRKYKESELPLDAIYMDIDYMEGFKDFTINRETFPDFEELVKELSDEGVRLVPIIDGGVRIEEGYETYEEGVKNNYFCKDENGDDFVVGVWPGDCHFPDMLNDEARRWFSLKYKFLLDKGIRGFWNDMNEPAIFYSRKNLKKALEKAEDYKGRSLDLHEFWELCGTFEGLQNNPEDYKSFYHNYHGMRVNHEDVHNLFGYYMTRGASEAFKELLPDEKVLMFSRASYIGMHRYGGVWMGDNQSVWSHLGLNLRMLPSLNMCGFLYIGADMGGFGCDTTEDLMLRWGALSMFMPLMRNHSALGTREQELYRFPESKALFRNLLTARYRLVPFLYSEYLKAVRDNAPMFSPLGFFYGKDMIARECEDQLMIGDSAMIAPVITQNATGRVVYFPESMKEIIFRDGEYIEGKIYEKGHHYVELPLGEANIFIRDGYEIPIGKAVTSIDAVDSSSVEYVSCNWCSHKYEMLDD